MTGHPFLIVDVFTDRALAGNQLAIFTRGEEIPEGLLQALALEMGFSETVFDFKPTGTETARIRIFTPRQELPFAGHPVLGTAVATGIDRDLDSVKLLTDRGEVAIKVTHDGRSGFGTMQQPIPGVTSHGDGAQLLTALGLA